MKKLWSLAIGCCLTLLCLCVLSIPAQAAQASGTCGSNITWELGEDGTMTISGTGRLGFDIDGLSVPWAEHRLSIKSLVISEGITRIGESLFVDCTNLTKVSLPDSVTGISWRAFYGCTNLKDVTIPRSVKYIGQFAFYNCDSLTSIVIPEGVTMEHCAFRYCDGLEKVTILGKAQIGNFAFADCSHLTDVTVLGRKSVLEQSVFQDDPELIALTFGGEAPVMDEYALFGVTAEVRYPCNDATWTVDHLSDYGGNPSWQINHSYKNGVCTLCGEAVARVQGLTQIGRETGSLRIAWDALEGATKYWVYVDSKIYASTTDTGLTITKRRPGREYRIAVTAMLKDGTILPLQDAEEYTAQTRKLIPTEITTGSNFITLTWDEEAGSKTWIYLGTSEEDLNLVASSAGSSYTVKKLAPDTRYYIRLAHLVDGKVVVSEELLCVQTDADDLLRVDAQLDGSTLILNWENNGNSYKHWVIIQIGDKTLTYSTTGTTFTYRNFDPTTCTVSVRGINVNGMYDYNAVEL